MLFRSGYTLRKTQPIQRPTDSFVELMRREYDALKAASRPAYKVSEKEALSFLRRVKKERGDDFRKGLPRAKAGELTESEYSRLLPYYLICDGGDLSDEYRLLSYEESILESKAFFDCLKAEELLEGKPDGIVIAKCPAYRIRPAVHTPSLHRAVSMRLRTTRTTATRFTVCSTTQ